MPRWVTWLAAGVAALLVLVLAAAVALPYVVDTPRIQAYVATSAAQTLGRPVRFSSVSLRVLPLPAVELRDLEVAEDPKFGPGPFLKLETGRIRLRLLPLLRGQVELGDIVLKKPLVTLIQGSDGRLNISTLGTTPEPRTAAKPGRSTGGPGAAGAVAVARVVVDDGVVTYVARGKGEAAAQYRLTGVDLTLTGGGPQLAFKGDARLQPGDIDLKLSDGLVALGGAKPLTEASLRGKVAVAGKDIAPLTAVAAGPEPVVGGSVKGTLALGGTVGDPTAAGEVELANLTLTQTNPQCPEPKRRTLTVSTVKLNTAWQDQRLAGKPLTATLAGGTVTTQLTVALDRGIRVQMADLGIRALPLEKVLVDYLCQGYAITGPLDLTGALGFEARDVLNTLTGPGQLRVGAGRVVGPQALALIGSVVRVGGAVSSILSADLPSRVFESPLEFDSITGTYRLANGLATTRDLLYSSRAMKVLIAGDYHVATGRMNLDMTITHGRGELKARVTGSAASPSIRVAPSTLLRDVDPGKAQKGIQDLLKRFGR
ncbi:MAG TPA: AsmA family protein [Methylomirabilota bacterium]|nr:AsmA family protein [Methylomirabilota bacterium]